MINNNKIEEFFSEKYNIVIYGCGTAATRIVRWMKKQTLKVHMCVDSAKSKHGTYFMEEFLIQASDVLAANNSYHIIVSPDNNNSILYLLNSYNYIYKKDYIVFDDILRYWSELLVSYIQKKSYKTKFIFAPNLQRMLHRSNTEQELIDIPVSLIDYRSWILSFPIHIRECYKNLEYFSEKYLQNIFLESKPLKYNGTYIQEDINTEYVNVSAGMRITTEQPQYYECSVHFFGNSYVYGPGVEDKYTIPSCLQRMLNTSPLNYIVLNHGIRGLPFESYIDKIESINIEDEDYVLLYFRDESILKEILMLYSISYIDLTEFLVKKRKDDIFFDWGSHLNYKGNMLVAKKIFELIFLKYDDISICTHGGKKNYYLYLKRNSDFNDYMNMLQEINSTNNVRNNGITGGIVMNCNPFTLGHKHLIKVAAQIVDILYVFIVSENRSEFDFTDRIKMVKEGTKDIKNIVVLPSGKFILSAETFPEYFSKEESKYTNIDMSEDIEIFGSIIAKELNITVRFVGEEPNDMVTRQYNESMKRILPKYNIKVLEIPRIKHNNNYISASIVRKLWHEGELQKLKEYVPGSTYKYLMSID